MIEQLQYTISSWRPKIWSKSFLSILLKSAILAGVIYYLVGKLGSIESIVFKAVSIQFAKLESGLIILLPVVLLMPLNWFLEAAKWKILAKPFQKISIFQSLHGVLCGLSLGFVTPHALGDYAGKALSLDAPRRELMVAPIFVGRFFQLLMTLLFGIIGFNEVLLRTEIDYVFSESILMLSGATVIMSFVIYMIRKGSFFFSEKLAPYLIVLKNYRGRDYLKVALFSFLRYLVFCSQFLIILYLFEIHLPFYVLFSGVTWIFLVKSTLPSFNFLSDLGIREFSALYFFSAYGINEVNLIAASLLLWAVNLLVPSLAGSFFVLKMKIFR